MYCSFAKKKPREWVHDALSLKSQGILRLHILWLLRLQITFHVRPVALFTLVQCPVRWCSMVLVLSHKRSILGHSLRSYLWYRTSSFTKNVPHNLHHCLGTDGETCFLCHAGTIEVTIFPGHFQA